MSIRRPIIRVRSAAAILLAAALLFLGFSGFSAFSAHASAPARPAPIGANPAPTGALPAPIGAIDATPHSQELSVVVPIDEVSAQRGELDALRAELAGANARIAELEGQLATAFAERLERERQWLRYTQGVAGLSSLAAKLAEPFEASEEARAADAAPATPGDVSAVEDGAAPASEVSAAEPMMSAAAQPAAAAAAAAAAQPQNDPHRDHELFLALRSLFAIEQVSGFDLLEAGTLARSDDPATRGGSIGPVVLRVLDEFGRAVGSLCADRLRLEASRSARTLTLVLEHGYERRNGERFTFAPAPGFEDLASVDADVDARGGVRRIVLPDIDPRVWIDAMPELFGPLEKQAPVDDGRWDLGALRAGLNQLLREDASAGYYRVHGFTGVQGSVLRDVQLDQLDREGRLERKLFADRMHVIAQEQGVQILLENGAQWRSDRKTPFLDGRYRIYIPRADAQAWALAGVPGLSEPPRTDP